MVWLTDSPFLAWVICYLPRYVHVPNLCFLLLVLWAQSCVYKIWKKTKNLVIFSAYSNKDPTHKGVFKIQLSWVLYLAGPWEGTFWLGKAQGLNQKTLWIDKEQMISHIPKKKRSHEVQINPLCTESNVNFVLGRLVAVPSWSSVRISKRVLPGTSSCQPQYFAVTKSTVVWTWCLYKIYFFWSLLLISNSGIDVCIFQLL